jgi:hypothetical protein
MTSAQIAIPRLTARGARKWYAGTCLVAVVVIGYQVLGDPTLWTWIGLPVLALALPLLLAATQRLEVDPHTGTFSSRNLWFWRRSVTVSADPAVALVDAANGTLLLQLGTFPRRVVIPVLAVHQYDHASQPPAILRLLADQLLRHAPHRRDLAAVLCQQADHVAGGGPLDRSPLAALLASRTAMPLPGRSRRHVKPQ